MDSDGERVLGKHPTKEKANKQLAAIEISKKQRLKETTMNSTEKFYAENYLNLLRERDSLLNQLNEMIAMPSVPPVGSQMPQRKRKEDMNKVTISASGMTEPTKKPDPMQPAIDPSGFALQRMPQTGGGMPPMGGEMPQMGQGQAPMAGQQKMSTPLHGFKPSPEEEFGQEDLLTKFFDDPETGVEEVPDKPSWQNLLRAQGNYVSSEVEKLKRSQRMA